MFGRLSALAGFPFSVRMCQVVNQLPADVFEKAFCMIELRKTNSVTAAKRRFKRVFRKCAANVTIHLQCVQEKKNVTNKCG